MRPQYLLFCSISALVVVFDLCTKKLALDNLAGTPPLEVIPGLFNLVLVFNRGAAFGFLNNPDTSWQIWLFLGVTLLTATVIIALLRSIRDNKPAFWGLALILGGAVGNMIDRIRYQAVVDFLDFYWQGWHWPAFNVADISICIGAGLTLIAMWRHDRKQKRTKQR
ncbi:MAG: lipoprotein signal peptidase [Desulfovibrionaceae bacterium]|nr:lipoprotein signal peptidase [Desulfovibrionaceae bacterium]